MSQRLGMADGRCYTINKSSQIINDHIMEKNGIKFQDNYSFRKLIQTQGPEILKPIQGSQGLVGCNACDKAL